MGERKESVVIRLGLTELHQILENLLPQLPEATRGKLVTALRKAKPQPYRRKANASQSGPQSTPHRLPVVIIGTD